MSPDHAYPTDAYRPRRPSPLAARLVPLRGEPTQAAVLAELRRVILAGDAPPDTVIPLDEVATVLGMSVFQVSLDTFTRYVPTAPDFTVYLNTSPTADNTAVAIQLDQLASAYPQVRLQSQADCKNQVHKQVSTVQPRSVLAIQANLSAWRTEPFGMLIQALVVIWCGLHGHHPDDVLAQP